MTQQRRARIDNGDIFEHDGHTFKCEVIRDDDQGTPWEQSDGHGDVSDWVRMRDGHVTGKQPGQRVLCTDDRNRYARLYDMKGAMVRAKRDGWGISTEETDELTQKLGRKPTQGEIRACAVERDYEYLRGWCTDAWTYVGVKVTLVLEGEDGDTESDYSNSLWGIESNATDYISDVARELAEQTLGEYNKYLETVME